MKEASGGKQQRKMKAIVVQGILHSVRRLEDTGEEPTFTAILADLRSKGILANHRSLRAYLDRMGKSSLLRMREEPVENSNVRPRQLYSESGVGPFIIAGERALLFHGLNWTVPAVPAVQTMTDIEGLVRARLSNGTLFASLEDAIVETLAGNSRTQRISSSLIFCSAMLATVKFDYEYLMRRARHRKLQDLVLGLLDGIDYLLHSPKPGVEDIRTLYEIRNHLAHQFRIPRHQPSKTFPLSSDDILDAVGKQLGVR